MADERIIFRGNPSPVSILGSLVVSLILFLGGSIALVLFWNKISPGPLRQTIFWLPLIPLLFLASKWVALKFLSYEITTERIKMVKGILSKRTDELELYRVKDTSLIEPFLYRMFGVGNIFIITGDDTTPQLELKAIKNAKEIREQLRASVEECRTRKRAGIVELE
ncbi:MAG: PH domain-containing protein [Verrucomicrobiota bacterium]